MFSRLTNPTRALKEKADLEAKLEAARRLTSRKIDTGMATAGAAWNKHWPTAESLLVEGLLSVAEEQLRDDKMLNSVFSKMYETLPVAARLVLSRDRFLEFTMARRDPLLLKVQSLRAERADTRGEPN